MSDMTQIELAIIAVIKNSGLSNYQIANELGVSRSLVGRWARTGKISVEKLGPLCKLLNVDANQVLQISYRNERELPKIKQEIIQFIRQLPEEDFYLLEATKKMLS
ncbi:helix-turn-helix domain-containing protein [Vibrio jasicida]|uniref:helix-turn-helix domain-containing protein n=1 Tax=Vibrio jasicida TaxID=766224 RepID=UPI0021571BD5|nr:helix-turn-helix domain-containing protein [Vibrio jasicida]|tara:strand:+ start:166 stop:483 length:318 start_codon:yes stop_codon:yes gene_type:complete